MKKKLSLRVRAAILAVTVCSGFAPTVAAGDTPQVYAGSTALSSFLADGAGTLSAWGENDYSCLGISGNSDQANPVAVPIPTGVNRWRTLTSAQGFNGNWTYAIGDNQQLYVAGWVGFSTPSAENLTLVIPPIGAGGWASVSASDIGWLAVATNGRIYGSINGSINLAPPSGAVRWTQVAIGSYFSPSQPNLFALDNRGKVFGFYSGTVWFSSMPPTTEVPIPVGATAWTNFSAGKLFVIAQANDGNLYGWGHNESGQLGMGSSFVYTNVPQLIPLPAGKTSWKSFSAGGAHVLATTADGQLFVWGAPGYGQLGLGDTTPTRKSPTAVPTLTNVTAIAAGAEHSLVVADCQVLTWGKNSSGQLGVGVISPYYPSPLAALFSYDICLTNPPVLPLVSITAPDPNASEGTWLSTLGQPATNTGRFEISRRVATTTNLNVNVAISGTASNGVDYLTLPTTVTIPANSNSASLLVVPAGSTLASDPSTIVVSILPDASYLLGNTTNATVTLIQYEAEPSVPIPSFNLQIFVGTNLNGQVFTIQASTNLIEWADIGTGTNVFGVVTVTETNRTGFRQRYFRAFLVSGQ